MQFMNENGNAYQECISKCKCKTCKHIKIQIMNANADANIMKRLHMKPAQNKLIHAYFKHIIYILNNIPD